VNFIGLQTTECLKSNKSTVNFIDPQTTECLNFNNIHFRTSFRTEKYSIHLKDKIRINQTILNQMVWELYQRYELLHAIYIFTDNARGKIELD